MPQHAWSARASAWSRRPGLTRIPGSSHSPRLPASLSAPPYRVYGQRSYQRSANDNTCTFVDPIFPMAEIIRPAGGAPDADQYCRSN